MPPRLSPRLRRFICAPAGPSSPNSKRGMRLRLLDGRVDFLDEQGKRPSSCLGVRYSNREDSTKPSRLLPRAKPPSTSSPRRAIARRLGPLQAELSIQPRRRGANALRALPPRRRNPPGLSFLDEDDETPGRASPVDARCRERAAVAVRAAAVSGQDGAVAFAFATPDGFSGGTDSVVAAPEGFSDGSDAAMAAPDGFSDGSDAAVVTPDAFADG